MFGGGPIFWSIKKKAAKALSLAEAEYQGTVNACIQAVWLQGILSEFDLSSTLSTVLFCDNQIYIKISTDPVTRNQACGDTHALHHRVSA